MNIQKISILVIWLAAMSHEAALSQNYKKLKVPTVEVNGDIKDAEGKIVGNLNVEGKIMGPDGNMVAYIDAFGTTIDVKTEEKICKTDKDGNMLAVVDKKVTSWKTYFPEPGMELCLIKDFKGNIVASTHKRHKQYGSSALYYFFGILKAAPPAPNTGSVNAGISKEEAAQKSLEEPKKEATSTSTPAGDPTPVSASTKKKSATKKEEKKKENLKVNPLKTTKKTPKPAAKTSDKTPNKKAKNTTEKSKTPAKKANAKKNVDKK